MHRRRRERAVDDDCAGGPGLGPGADTRAHGHANSDAHAQRDPVPDPDSDGHAGRCRHDEGPEAVCDHDAVDEPAARFPVPVTAGPARQVITVDASGTRASVALWEKRAGGWTRVAGPWAGHVGSSGVVAAAARKQGTGTTPAGTFTLTEAFGIAADPGARLPYHRVGGDDWWVQDNNSRY